MGGFKRFPIRGLLRARQAVRKRPAVIFNLSISHETRLTSNGDGPISWIGGFYFTKQDKMLKKDMIL